MRRPPRFRSSRVARGKEGRRGAIITSILVVMISLVLNSLLQITEDWEKGATNFLPLWIEVTLLYCYPAVLVATLKAEWAQYH